MVEIDGSYGEGGGQIMRSAVALSLLTGRPFRMTAIRAGRAKPGLKAQHLTILQAAERLFGSTVTGATLGGLDVEFHPGTLRGDTHEINIGTAGSITLVLQTLLPIAVFAPEPTLITIIGGTDVSFSPTLDYVRHVVLPLVSPFANAVAIDCEQRGFMPTGGGRVCLSVTPRFSNWSEVYGAIAPLDLCDCPAVERIEVHSVAGDSLRSSRVAERQIDGVREILGQQVKSLPAYATCQTPGSAITVVARRRNGAVLAADGLGQRDKRAEQVGREAAEKLSHELKHNAPVDEHLADHLIPWLAFRSGRFRATTLSPHTLTHIWLVEQFLGSRFQVDETKHIVSVLPGLSQ